MKLLSFIFIVFFIQLSYQAFSQITIKEKDAPFPRVITSIEKQSGYVFIYDEVKVKLGNVSVDLKNASLDEALQQCFNNTPFTYKVIEKTIILTPRNQTPAANPPTVNAPNITAETFLISGEITDEKDGIIPGAIIFLTNSKKITSSDVNGTFHMGGLAPGTYELVVKILGFNTYTQNITIQNESTNVHIRLTEANIPLNEIVVKAKYDPSRAKTLKLFIQNFIGESANAQFCKIVNPDVIKLHYDSEKDLLEAWTDGFLTIKNKALGYQVKYLLSYFVFDARNHIYAHHGFVYFEELKGSAKKQRRWQYNRELAYEGSIRHFFASVFNHTATTDGFLVYQFPQNLSHVKLADIKPINTDSLFSVVDNDFKLLKLKPLNQPDADTSKLYVVYTKEQESSVFDKSDGHIDLPINLPSVTNQVSQIIPNTDGILLDKNGTFTPASKVLFTGYWSWERLADLMPFDYISSPKSLDIDPESL